MARKPAQNLNLFLLKEDIQSFEDALREPDAWATDSAFQKVSAMRAVPPDAIALYARKSAPKKSKWIRFLETGLAPGEVSLFQQFGSQAAGGLLLLKTTVPPCGDAAGQPVTRYFAVTYGFGRSFLKDSCWESRFGLRIALNKAEGRPFRQAHVRTHQGQTVQKAMSVSRLSGLQAFGFDSEQDMVEKLTAKLPKDDQLGVQLSGADSVAIACKLEYDDLVAKVKALYGIWNSDAWKTKFPEVLSIQPVKDKDTRSDLNDQLIADLTASSERIHLSPTEFVNYDENFAGFLWTGDAAEPTVELLISELHARLGDNPWSLEWLKSQSVQAVNVDGQLLGGPWTAFDCLVAEVEVNNRLYVLTGSEWFEFDKDYVSTLNTFINSIPSSNLMATHPREPGEGEDAYNKRIGGLNDTGLLMGHMKMVPHTRTAAGGTSTIEVCDFAKPDVLLEQGKPTRHCLIHIKNSNEGAELGHLFNQGLVSADLILRDSVFRATAKEKLPDGFAALIGDNPTGAEFAVVYAVMTESPNPLSQVFTLFSKVVLRRAAEDLRVRGIQVFLDKITEAPN